MGQGRLKCRMRSVGLQAAGLGLMAVTLSVASASASPTLGLECADLSRDDLAKVEARVRASLLTRDVGDMDLSIQCDQGIATVSASVGSPETRRGVSVSGAAAGDSIVALVERAVTQLFDTGSKPEERVATTPDPETAVSGASLPGPPPPTEALPAPPPPLVPSTLSPSLSEPPLVPPATAPKALSRAPAPLSHRPWLAPGRTSQHSPAECSTALGGSRIRLDVAAEAWRKALALGAMAGLEQGVGEISYSFLAGGSRLMSEQPLFRAVEWAAAGELGWQPPGAVGIRASVRLGLSVLAVTPAEDVSPLTAVARTAGYLGVDLRRPVWIGRVGLAPGVGMRAFTAKRSVNVDGQSELRLSTPTIHATIAFLLRVGD